MNHNTQSGEVNPLLITSIFLGLLTIALAGVSVWAYMNYTDQKNNTDEKIAVAVDIAEDAQAEKLDAQFKQREKSPVRTFKGPSDLGSVAFEYPKTWSVYTASEVESLETYLQPNVVPPIEDTQPYALRVNVNDDRYEDTIEDYEGQVEDGDLKSDTIKIDDFTGIRLDGKFSEERSGSLVIFKIRDKTLTLATDSTSYVDDFNKIVLKSLTFNP